MHQIMQNKPNFGNDKMNLSVFIAMNYVNLYTWLLGKTKPIQSQFKPNQSQFKPISGPNKAKTNPKQTQSRNSSRAPMSARVFNSGKSRDNFLDLCVLI